MRLADGKAPTYCIAVSLHQPPADRSPLAGLRLSLVGPGRVGTSLASWSHSLGAQIDQIAGRDLADQPAPSAHAMELAARLGGTAHRLEGFDSSSSDILILSVLDPALAETAAALADRPQARIVLHTSGSFGAEILEPLEQKGHLIGTLHPLRAFPRPSYDPKDAAGTFFALGGNEEAIAAGRRMSSAFGGTCGEILSEHRPIYHLLASVAAGGVVTLVALAARLASEIGLPKTVAGGYLGLARGALDGVDTDGDFADSITGPLARGDVETFLHEAEALAKALPDASRSSLELVAHLAIQTLRLRSPAASPEQPSVPSFDPPVDDSESTDFQRPETELETALVNRGILDRL